MSELNKSGWLKHVKAVLESSIAIMQVVSAGWFMIVDRALLRQPVRRVAVQSPPNPQHRDKEGAVFGLLTRWPTPRGQGGTSNEEESTEHLVKENAGGEASFFSKQARRRSKGVALPACSRHCWWLVANNGGRSLLEVPQHLIL